MARADERQKLERLCRYVSRPAVSEKRLSLTANGQVRYQLKLSKFIPDEFVMACLRRTVNTAPW
jgi:hypothetical protein